MARRNGKKKVVKKSTVPASSRITRSMSKAQGSAKETPIIKKPVTTKSKRAKPKIIAAVSRSKTYDGILDAYYDHYAANNQKKMEVDLLTHKLETFNIAREASSVNANEEEQLIPEPCPYFVLRPDALKAVVDDEELQEIADEFFRKLAFKLDSKK